MRKWGVIVTLFYAAVLLLLIFPACMVFSYSGVKGASVSDIRNLLKDFYTLWFTWAWAGTLIVGEALLLLVSVDASHRRLRPRTNIVVSIAVGGALLGLLSFAATASVAAAVRGDHFDQWGWILFVGGLLAPWLVWTFVFYRYSKNSNDVPSRATKWLLRGSVLELLIAVPSHVIVRRRHECCAPAVTGWGIATGIAVMLLSFGPSVLFLYKKRMQSLRGKTAAAG